MKSLLTVIFLALFALSSSIRVKNKLLPYDSATNSYLEMEMKTFFTSEGGKVSDKLVKANGSSGKGKTCIKGGKCVPEPKIEDENAE